VNVLIVEDEALAARRLSRMTREILGQTLSELTIATSVADAETHIVKSKTDLVLLDLNLNGTSGFDLFARFTAGSFHTIIVSASIDKAITAFEYGVLDFVAKPFDKERLQKAFDRLQLPRGDNRSILKYLSVKNQGEVRLIPLDTVHYFKGADDYVEIHLRNNTFELYGKSMDSLLQILPTNFYRIHKSFIVDLSEAKTIHVHGGGRYELELLSGHTFPVSRTQYPTIQARMQRS